MKIMEKENKGCSVIIFWGFFTLFLVGPLSIFFDLFAHKSPALLTLFILCGIISAIVLLIWSLKD